MALRDPMNVRFSQLKDNWESCSFFYDLSLQGNSGHDAVFRRYG